MFSGGNSREPKKILGPHPYLLPYHSQSRFQWEWYGSCIWCPLFPFIGGFPWRNPYVLHAAQQPISHSPKASPSPSSCVEDNVQHESWMVNFGWQMLANIPYIECAGFAVFEPPMWVMQWPLEEPSWNHHSRLIASEIDRDHTCGRLRNNNGLLGMDLNLLQKKSLKKYVSLYTYKICPIILDTSKSDTSKSSKVWRSHPRNHSERSKISSLEHSWTISLQHVGIPNLLKKTFHTMTHGIHETAIFTYIDPIKINHSSR